MTFDDKPLNVLKDTLEQHGIETNAKLGLNSWVIAARDDKIQSTQVQRLDDYIQSRTDEQLSPPVSSDMSNTSPLKAAEKSSCMCSIS